MSAAASREPDPAVAERHDHEWPSRAPWSEENDGNHGDRALQVFLAERTRLLRLARRVTRDRGSAEEVVQEAWLRWQRADRSGITNPAAFLTTTTTHLSINVIQSARHRHELTTQSPLASAIDSSPDPTQRLERRAALEQSLGLLLARMSANELTVYVLRKAFDYSYLELARLLSTTVPNARQLARRAQLSLTGPGTRQVDEADHRELVDAFLAAAGNGSVQQLESVLVARRERSSRCRVRAFMHGEPGSRHRASTPATEGPQPPARGFRCGAGGVDPLTRTPGGAGSTGRRHVLPRTPVDQS